MKKTIFLISAVILLWPPLLVQSQSVASNEIKTGSYFYIGSSVLDLNFKDNRANLERFVRSLRQVLSDSNYVVNRVEVVGTASPDGSLERNMDLAGQRADALVAYIIQNTTVSLDQIKILNGGENWAGLRAMIAASDMPYKNDMLRIMDTYSDDRDVRKRNMQYFADSKPWNYMYANFFPTLRMGAGSGRGVSALIEENWRRTAQLIEQSSLSEEVKQRLLAVINSETDPARRAQRFETMLTPEVYQQFQQDLVSGLLSSSSVLSKDNWSLLRDRIVGDAKVPHRAEALRIINSITPSQERDKGLRALGEGTCYRYIQDHFFPELLIASALITEETYKGADLKTTALSEENWNRLRTMVEESDIPGKADILNLINNVADPVERLRQLEQINNGRSYIYIIEVFFPELLYGVSPAAQENWIHATSVLKQSDIPTKEAILEIIRTTPPGLDREKAIRNLDGGVSWGKLGSMILPDLLRNTDMVQLNGSGMQFSYEISSVAQAGQMEGQRRMRIIQAEQRIRDLDTTRDQEAERRAREQVRKETTTKTLELDVLCLAIKTNLLFDLATAVNLEVEVPLGKRWSILASGVFPRWNFDNRTCVYLTELSVEGRYWLNRQQNLSGDRTHERLTGHFVGVYGNWLADYDLQWGRTGVMGSGYGFGLTYGYAHRLSRYFNMEFSLGVGAVCVDNKSYGVAESYQYKELTESFSGWKVLPTRAKISLVWQIGGQKAVRK